MCVVILHVCVCTRLDVLCGLHECLLLVPWVLNKDGGPITLYGNI